LSQSGARNVAANANETDAGQLANKKPVANFRLASVEASVWSNQYDKGEFYNVTLQRRYQDRDQQWQTSHSYGPSDALALAKVADMAVTKIIELQQARK
jgi:hypothetical protein